MSIARIEALSTEQDCAEVIEMLSKAYVGGPAEGSFVLVSDIQDVICAGGRDAALAA